jgi:hypothetical protein
MRLTSTFIFTMAATGLVATTTHAQFVDLNDETSARLVLDPAFQYLNLEKGLDQADFDQDGDQDVICAMKFVGSIEGGFPNLLLMNENGVLVDRTQEYGTASDIPGDTGLMEPTNDRNLSVVDVNNDGWMDIVSATTMSDDVVWTHGQPRCYLNLGEDVDGNWLGFRHERDRIPQFYPVGGSPTGGMPRFCDIAIGDFNGDGYQDLFFTDYDTPETAGNVECQDINGDGDTNDPGECQDSPSEDPVDDYDSKLFLNWGDTPSSPGAGYFYDTQNTIMTAAELSTDFGNTAAAGDFNGDGSSDIVRVNTLGANVVEVLWNDGSNPGSDFDLEQIQQAAPYFVVVGDINGDALLDMVVVDDSQDRYLINTGNGGDGRADFISYIISDSLGEFGNTAKLFDIDNDGDLDCFIADVDADLPSFCPGTGRRAHFYENTGNIGELFVEDSNPIPTSDLAASFDVAAIDINLDGWLDILQATCRGFTVWMNQPPINIAFQYPDGLPTTVTPGTETTILVDLIPAGGTVDAAGTMLMTSINGASFSGTAMQNVSGNTWEATLPAIDCDDTARFYVASMLDSGERFNDPPTAPASSYQYLAVSGFELTTDDFESGDGGFTTSADPSVTAGFWERADPIATISGSQQIAPGDDASESGTLCWITQNGEPGGTAGSADLDGGPVYLTSPIIDLEDSDALISVSVWLKSDDEILDPANADDMLIQVSNNGSSWTTVHVVDSDIDQDGDVDAADAVWGVRSFYVSEHVTPNATVQVRFTVSDNPNNSVTEAGVDEFTVEKVVCEDEPECTADINGDGNVDGSDLATLLGSWNTSNPKCDLDGSGTVDGADLSTVLGFWGPC